MGSTQSGQLTRYRTARHIFPIPFQDRGFSFDRQQKTWLSRKSPAVTIDSVAKLLSEADHVADSHEQIAAGLDANIYRLDNVIDTTFCSRLQRAALIDPLYRAWAGRLRGKADIA